MFHLKCISNETISTRKLRTSEMRNCKWSIRCAFVLYHKARSPIYYTQYIVQSIIEYNVRDLGTNLASVI